MAADLNGRRIAVLATDGFEQVEYEQPRQAVEQAGGQVSLVSVHGGEIQAMNGDIDKGDRFTVDAKVSDVSPDDFDGLVLPGGTINPDRLRIDADAVGFVRSFVQAGKPVGAICHGPWTLAEADVVRGRRVTSFPSIRTDLRNAGADVVDEQVVTDQGMVTSRNPDDLPAFCAKIVEEFAEGRHRAAARA
ncbi:type 1 glutamine amidotransferase [Saccharopolyspora erythraea]|uniref:type 1 glutamine amidotransferase domain-containing protein n=1 Tax=Saccharopolyspora erythraea TaxID=1836 RepID=UPI001BA7143D|nr:type 1 glutamine amidotransferase domain-containing protein [Saccharopolyspora erythraea]QUH03500.1 type 1 glutamine amidotransferase [Saccharopolyspora erythraea]